MISIIPKGENYRAYTYTFLVYDEWIHRNDVFRLIMNLPCKYFAISPLHDMDFLENGKLDKPHYHCILRFHNAVWSHAFQKKYLLTIMPKKFDEKSSFRGAVRYLVHADDPDKFQYSKEDIISSDYEMTFSFFNDVLTKSNSDEFDEWKFLDEVNWKIQKNDFRTELEMILWINKSGYGRFFNKYKFALHNDFSEVKRANYIYNKKNERNA